MSILNDFKTIGKFMNPGALQEPGKSLQATHHGDHANNLIMSKMNEMMDMINIHLSTVETQNDIKAEIIECAKQ